MIFQLYCLNNSINATGPKVSIQQGNPQANPSFVPQRVTKPLRLEISGAITTGGTLLVQFGNKSFTTTGMNFGNQIDGMGATSECMAGGGLSGSSNQPIVAQYILPVVTIFNPWVINLSNFVMPAGGPAYALYFAFSNAIIGTIAATLVWQELAI